MHAAFPPGKDLYPLLLLADAPIILPDLAPGLPLPVQSPFCVSWALLLCSVMRFSRVYFNCSLHCCTPPPDEPPEPRGHATFIVISPGPSPVWPIIDTQYILIGLMTAVVIGSWKGKWGCFIFAKCFQTFPQMSRLIYVDQTSRGHSRFCLCGNQGPGRGNRSLVALAPSWRRVLGIPRLCLPKAFSRRHSLCF